MAITLRQGCLSYVLKTTVVVLAALSPAIFAQSVSPPPSAVLGSGGIGPDVLGLRIGMSPAEARAIYNARFLVSDSMRRQNHENSKTLAFRLPGTDLRPVPDGTYFSRFGFDGRGGDGTAQTFYVYFTAVPRSEQVVWILRRASFQATKQPTFGTFEKALLEKYGPPTYSPKGYPGLHYWFFNKDGTLKKTGSVGSDCVTFLATFESGRGDDWILTTPTQFTKLANDCGAIYLELGMGFAGVTYTGPDTIVQNYIMQIIGIEESIRASDSTRAIIEKAMAAAGGEKIKAAKQQKPSL